ncbi:MAG: 30S ribosomal protein S6 [Anaerolineae bacterium]|uniref:30S ribosomal protein S6 n=1 Tax=Candidatus Amarolinea dominans TaxID=3140696 RepID=UPI001DA96A59|nr:30S ribosomal protein S6 [Anaerolineae bacterium]MBK6434204.1 30S ribosomal protein S6 [Anaerolineae bacterium]MBK7201457.1 30S ribosomal protein S6 [Anaerolineae bacterium]MBK9095449.1 30S ribosomal protein S6 [Anaerolineae bacterium]MBK9230542.1 30S ribosomal protein S6 [Anaerolineae bacterium]
MNEYELMMIVRTELDEEGVNTLTERIAEFIRTTGGEVIETQLWGRRTLAYLIRKQREGNYILMRIRLLPSATAALERSLRLNENVLRHLLTTKPV